jgi:hypothetical protein
MDVQPRRIFFCSSMFLFFILGWLTACSRINASAPPLYLPPTEANPPAPLAFTPTFQLPGPSPTPACTNALLFGQDVTIPDGTVVAPGSLLDKQWQVQNSGTCNWDNRYRLRLISGEPLGAATEQALFPARSGTQAILQIAFTAPTATGNYYSEWQAFDPLGMPFGDSLTIKISVNTNP